MRARRFSRVHKKYCTLQVCLGNVGFLVDPAKGIGKYVSGPRVWYGTIVALAWLLAKILLPPPFDHAHSVVL